MCVSSRSAVQVIDMTRRLVFIVIAMTLAGAATADCVLLLSRKPTSLHLRVGLEDSLPVAFIGGFVALCGSLTVIGSWYDRPGLRRVATVVASTWLCASVAAMIGWHIGNSSWNRSESQCMAYGAMGGALFGLILGIQQCREHRKVAACLKAEADAAPSASPDRDERSA
jgi:hypothetical protein